jgi:hypothetical protein
MYQAAACAAGLVACPSSGLTHFVFARAAAFIAVRARVSYDVSIVRFSAATGVGVVDRVVGVVQRSGGSGGLLGGLSGGAVANYASPAFDFDVGVGVKLSSKLALTVGAKLWVEDAGTARSRKLGDDPQFEVTGGTQVILLPHVGFDFGEH